MSQTQMMIDLFIPMDKWGDDHWSTLAYVESRVVDYGGKIKEEHLRGHLGRRPEKYPTRLNDGTTQEGHDDFDCIQDMLVAGLVYHDYHEKFGYRLALTDMGWCVAGALRKHRGITGKFGTFVPDES